MINNSRIKEYTDKQSLAYILESPDMFVQVGFKVLQTQEKNGFIKCTRVTHNGKPKLVYNISDYKPLKSLLFNLRPDVFITIMTNLIDAIIETGANIFRFFVAASFDNSRLAGIANRAIRTQKIVP